MNVPAALEVLAIKRAEVSDEGMTKAFWQVENNALGVTIEGVEYGHFTGEVQFEPDGSVGVIDLERSTFQGRSLRLEIDSLLIERSQLRNKYGAAFLTEHGAEDLRSHRRRFELFRALAESLQAAFEGDVIEHFRQARSDAKGCNAA